MKRNFVRHVTAMCMVLLSVVSCPLFAEVWDMATDWSDTSAVNGPWNYGCIEINNNQQFYPFTGHGDYGVVFPADFSGPQTFWKDPWGMNWGMFKSNGTCQFDVPIGRVGGRSAMGMRWTAPREVTVRVTGGCWEAKDGGGTTPMMALWAGTQKLISNIAVPARSAGYDSSNIWTFNQAITDAGGSPSSLRYIHLNQGQNIDLIFSLNFGYWVGMDLTITEETDPGSIRGTITDASSEMPVQGAAVEAVGAGNTTTTGSDGSYTLTGVEPGSYTLRVSKTGYTTKDVSVAVSSGQETVADVEIVQVGEQVWNLAADWSDSSNPSGAWTYGWTDPVTGLFTRYENLQNISGGDFTGIQPVWNHVGWTWWSMIFKSNGTLISGIDIPKGRVGGYELFGALWTAPSEVTVNISGGVWMCRDTGAGKSFSLLVNDIPVLNQVGAPFPRDGYNSGNIYTFAEAVLADGGTLDSLQAIHLMPGETIAFSCSGSNYLGVNLKITTGTPPAPSPGSMRGKVTDASNGLGIAGALVQLLGTNYSTTTAGDGTYTISNVDVGPYTLAAAKNGYAHNSVPVFVSPGKEVVKDIALTSYAGLDMGRWAVASANTGTARYINDANPRTEWHNPAMGPAGVLTGDWVQLTWSDPVTVASVLVDSAGPNADYSIQSSADGVVWTEVKRVTSREVGYTHWMEHTTPNSPVTTRHLRLVSNVDDTVAKIWSVESFRWNGAVSGAVKDSVGAGIEGASVYAYESIGGGRGACRFMAQGTTGVGGTYTIPVPAGPVVVTASVSDGLAASVAGLSVSEGLTTSVPDITVAQLQNSAVRFSDNFDDGAPELRWDSLIGTWGADGSGGFHVVTPGSPNLQVAAVKDLSLLDFVVEVDAFSREAQIVGRYKDRDNMLFFDYDGGANMYWHEVHGGVWSPGPIVPVTINDSKPYRMKASVVENQILFSISDGYNTYWIGPLPVGAVTWSGKVGVSTWVATGYSDQYFDNFLVYSTELPPLSTIPAAKAASAGWAGRVQGIVTAALSDYNSFFVEAADRSCAIKVTPLPDPAVEIGDEVEVAVLKQADGSFGQSGVTVLAKNKDPGTLGVNNKNLMGNPGPDNKDLLVKTWGKLVDAPVVNPDGSTRFHITDGTAIPGGPIVADVVEVIVPASVQGVVSLAKDDNVVVSGIAGLSNGLRAVTVREAADVAKN
ncbi:MAG: carboxypeptidase regulatory-like domain-containing protein [Armatimonadetes bacterium]|nr:carboxypeptidase regulatory-like domain-containing protein [Armatimonadota bacterium]